MIIEPEGRTHAHNGKCPATSADTLRGLLHRLANADVATPDELRGLVADARAVLAAERAPSTDAPTATWPTYITVVIDDDGIGNDHSVYVVRVNPHANDPHMAAISRALAVHALLSGVRLTEAELNDPDFSDHTSYATSVWAGDVSRYAYETRTVTYC